MKKNTSDNWLVQYDTTMRYGLEDENWDVITIQQASGFSGIQETYNYDIDTITDFINSTKTNNIARLFWHMTWAYDTTSTHPDFIRYNNSQITMYNAIVNAVKNKILPNTIFNGIIPSGTAIQNARTGCLEGLLTRDGFHLSYDIGRYIAGITWFASITGKSIYNLTFAPGPSVYEHLPYIKKLVNAALFEPFKITTII